MAIVLFMLTLGLFWWMDRAEVPSAAEQRLAIRPQLWLVILAVIAALSGLAASMFAISATLEGAFSYVDGFGMAATLVAFIFIVRALMFHLTIRATDLALYYGFSRIPWNDVTAITPGVLWLQLDLTKNHWGRPTFYAGGPLTNRLGGAEIRQLEELRSSATGS